MNTVSWNQLIADLPGASILQTSEWAEIKRNVGWEPAFQQWKDKDGKIEAAAMILKKPLGLGKSFWYIPRGPLLDWNNLALRDRVIDDILRKAKEEHAIFLKIDPDVPVGFGIPNSDSYQPIYAGNTLLGMYKKKGWHFSDQQIQFANSVWIDLHRSEEELLTAMKQRTRYKIRLAEKKGVIVRIGTPSDFEEIYAMYAETSSRDQFIIREKSYYLDVWNRFFSAGILKPLIAEVEGEAVAGLMLFIYAQKAWYIYGMSRDLHREKMPNYLLQWEAIRTAKAAGAAVYDLWGAPDHFDENDRMWGVYQFKKGLGGYEVITPGAWDYPLNKPIYRLFVKTLPKFLAYLKKKNRNTSVN
jgi:peptidoglycan pentaglycine glycine transferase (the first glycine)